MSQHHLVGKIVIDTTESLIQPEYLVGKDGFMAVGSGDFTPYDSAFPGPQFFEQDAFAVKPSNMSNDVAEVLDTLHYKYTQWSEAKGPVAQAFALTAFHESLHDLCTWHPEHDINYGDNVMPWQRNDG